MRDSSDAERRVSPPAKSIPDHFEALAMEISRAIERLPDGPGSAEMLQRLRRALELAERGGTLGRSLPEV
jgi:hypothetical protein